jgi:TRAP-type C4-dicarboxylate transport system permease small subunit
VRKGAPPMRALSRLYGGFYAAIGLVCGLLIGAIAFGITVDVLMRNTGLGSLPWVMEVNEYALYTVTALGAPWALHRGAHVRVDVLVQGLPRGAARWLDAATDLIGLVASGVLVYYAAQVAAAAIRDNARLIKVLIIPEWWVYAVLVAGGALLAIEFARRLVKALAAGPHANGKAAA